MTNENPSTQTPVTLGLAFTAGIGFIAMASALGVGVVQGSSADGNAIGLIFVAGLVLFILGCVAWVLTVQPYKRFDDINVPQYTGHQGHDAHEKHE